MVNSFPQNQDNHARQVVSRDRVVPAFAVSGQDWPEAGLRWGFGHGRASKSHLWCPPPQTGLLDVFPVSESGKH